MSSSSSHKYDYDFAVLGGGSGGLAASKEAVKLLLEKNPSAKVVVFDYVTPTQHGTKWGLGGTCVNVGCVPKKLFHYTGLLGKAIHEEAPQYGWKNTSAVTHEWKEMVTVVTNYIRSLNFSYKVSLRSAKVDYLEATASFVDPHTISFSSPSKSGQITADKVLIAVGGRPDYADTPGGEIAITSDDIFWQKKAPGKTLVVGSGYIGVENAGFLHHLGYDTTLMVRGTFMRKFDVQASQQIGELMERSGVRFLLPASIVAMRKVNRPFALAGSKPDANGLFSLPSTDASVQRLLYPSGAVEVRPLHGGRSKWEIPEGPIEVQYVFNNDPTKKVHSEIFDTVMVATGRKANVHDLHIQKAGVQLYHGKVLVDENEQTTAANIYCIGDASVGIKKHGIDAKQLDAEALERPELTPVAIQAGILLARRLFGGAKELMQYRLIPSTVFSSPVEYGFIGYSDEDARQEFGKENIDIFWSRFGHLEISPMHAEPVKNRSWAFTKNKLWAAEYTRKNKLDWNEVSFNTDTFSQVFVHTTDEKEEPKKGTITNKYQGTTGDFLYDVELSDGGMALTGLPESRLSLQEEALAQQDELFTKAVCLSKLVVDRRSGRVIGFHFVGPNAGEVTQGFALAMQLGAKKEDFDRMVGIHPTAAEEFAVLGVQQSSGASPLKKAGCGGGTCG